MEPPLKKQRKTLVVVFTKNQSLPSPEERKRLAAIEQNSPEWHLEREKRLHASATSCRVGHGELTVVDQWKYETGRLVRELGEKTEEMFQHGHDGEPLGAAEYSKLTGRKDVRTVGIVVHPTIAWVACSPDRLVGNDGMLEIKCPYYGHVPRSVPEKHMDQIQYQLACTGRKWCDYVVYVKGEKLAVWRVYPSGAYWTAIWKRLDVYATCIEEDIEPTMIKLRDVFPTVRVERPGTLTAG